MIFLRVSALAVRNQYHDAADQRKRSQDRGQRHTVMLFLGRLDGANIQNFLVGGVGKALIHQGNHAENNQDQSEWLHSFDSSWLLNAVASKTGRPLPSVNAPWSVS